MYKQLDNLLSAVTTVDSWYDDGCIIAAEILEHFGQSDWDKVTIEVLDKPLYWKKKLAYCLDSTQHTQEFEILLSLLSVEDSELSEICIDTLRSYTSTEHKQRIINHPMILDRVHDAISGAGTASKNILGEFLKGLT
ncbi:hypothetical protein QVE09_24870 [Paenibacillus sp. ClWae2A]|uniref:hypothetical protein n=1 Tax=Paenibacillus sp. ClWae2A TaxID=3057177 RepID=UPI0028F6AB79|nr:hypothetical protein [Paenibacillus sp. ClWae2A]MDT9722145.1 hypothetical protein [Paenibacillus sp. ClWae2A]